MTIDVLNELKAIGVEVIPLGENLLIRPASKVPADLKERLKAHKPEVLAALRANCRHCSGLAECPCPACTLRRTDKAVPCLMCRPKERQVWLAATRPQGCWHCGGTWRCKCIGRDENESGQCACCKGSGKATARLN